MGARYFGVGEETTFKQAAAISKYIDIVDEGISLDNQVIKVENVADIIAKYVAGPLKIGGTVNFYVEPENCGQFFKWALGSVVTSQPDAGNAPNTYKHEFTPADEIKSFTAEVGLGDTNDAIKYKGMAIKALSLEAVAKEALMGSIDVVAADLELVTAGTPSFSALAPFVFHQGQVKIAGTANGDIEAFKIKYENGIDEDAFAIGDRTLARLKAGARTITGEFDIAFTSNEQLKRFLGSATATSPQDTLESVALKLTMTGPLIEATYNYQLEIDLPRVVYNTTKANINKRERVVQNVAFEAYVDATAGYAIKITLINKEASI